MPENEPSQTPSGAAPGADRKHALTLRIGSVLLLITFVVLGVVCVRKGWFEPADPGAPRKRKYRGTDFTAYYSAGELARKGRDIYDWPASSTPYRPFIYPPIFALVPMAPLSLLPHNAALTVFYVLNVLLLLGSAWLLRKMLWPPGTESAGSFWRLPEVGLFIAVLLCWRFFDSNLKLGQANLIILFLTALGLYALHRERGTWGGLAIACATAVKATPGLFGLYFFWTRRGWAMLGGAVGLLVFLFLIPSAALGWRANLDALERFAGAAGMKFAAPGSAEERGADPADDGEEDDNPRAVGISLRGTLLKLCSPTVSMHHRKEGDTRSVNVFDFAPETTSRFVTVLSLVLLGVTIWLTAGRAAQTGAFPLGLSWGLLTLTMLLISPLTRKAHCVALLIPAAVLVAALQQDRLTGAARRLAWSALILLPSATLLTAEGLVGDRAGEFLHAIGTSTWAMVALYVATAMALRQELLAAERTTNPMKNEK